MKGYKKLQMQSFGEKDQDDSKGENIAKSTSDTRYCVCYRNSLMVYRKQKTEHANE